MSDNKTQDPLDFLEHGQTDATFSLPTLSPGSIAILLGIFVFGAVIAYTLIQRQNDVQPTSGPAPDFLMTTFDGEEFMLSDLRGKVVVINFWASWCTPCADEAPSLQLAWEQYAPRGDVVFLGVAYADNGPESLAYLERFAITYINGPDLGTRISDLYSITGVPETFVVDQEGNIAYYFYAGVTAARLSVVIDGLLEG